MELHDERLEAMLSCQADKSAYFMVWRGDLPEYDRMGAVMQQTHDGTGCSSVSR
jgi:hypothetical protein